jgi:BON domain
LLSNRGEGGRNREQDRSELKKDVEDELQWEPKINAARIGVSVRNGAVSLTGEVDTYPERWAAEDAAKRVGGVRAVAEDLTVKILGTNKHTDAELAEVAVRALRWDVWVPNTITRGSADYNMTLGQSRADAVTTYLTARGVDSAHASSTSRGAMDATGVDEAGWAHDRRVDVLLAK